MQKIENRANTFEIFGWDLMIDHNLNVWLLECNKSPDLNPTTSVTQELTDSFFSDLAKIFCDNDYRDLN